jgi:hypothetical protein
MLYFFTLLAVGVIDGLDAVVLDTIPSYEILQDLPCFIGKGGGSAKDLDVQGPAKIVGGSGVRRSAGSNDGVGLVVSGNDGSVVRLCKHK